MFLIDRLKCSNCAPVIGIYRARVVEDLCLILVARVSESNLFVNIAMSQIAIFLLAKFWIEAFEAAEVEVLLLANASIGPFRVFK